VTLTAVFQQVLDVIRQSPGGCTDNEVADALGINLRTANGRRVALHRQALVTPAGSQDAGSKLKRTIWAATSSLDTSR